MSFHDQTVVFSGKSSVTASLGANDPQVGTRKAFDGDEYIWVYNGGGEQIQPSYGAVVLGGSGTSGYTVTISSVTSADFLLGVCKHATITTGAYGWLLTKGQVAVEMEADNSCVTNALLAVAANGEFAFKSNSTGYPAPAVGKALVSIASGASGNAFISVF